ncbi:phosphatase PAP2 family protein [Kineococcus sp. R8]|uniref:phosphatase PAP2 family protein n=1 Tax=Kineococcus siccus TaxID=2696567 RepID=UPI001412F56A|nr:phosphatase PAP2 family protein [Kineococcus siccus]
MPRPSPPAAAAFACAAAAGLLSVAVVRGWTAAVDGELSRAAVAAAVGSPALATLGHVVEQVTQPVWFHTAGALALGLAFRRGHRREAAAALVAGGAAAALSPLVKALAGRPRPALDAGLTTATGGSYPSGHALASATVLLYLLALLLPPAASRARRRWRRAAVAVVLLVVGADRLLVGAHWPSDVLAGWLLAGALVGTATAVARRAPPPDHRPT